MNSKINSKSLFLAVAFLIVAAVVACADGGAPPAAAASSGAPEQKVQGKVVEAKMTACGIVDDKPGTCEGTIVVEPQGQSRDRVALLITRDVVLKRGDDKLFLPQLNGAQVTAAYRLQEGKNVATSVVAQ